TFLGVQRLDLLEGAITSNSVTTLLVTSRAGGDVDLDALRETLSGITAPAWYAQRPGGEWVSGAVAAVEDSKWLTTLGAVCL
ncbi:hypothetical protein ACQUZK_10120, partial [Streptococcus pyogenes]|uniref:hypothetical protein n=1 Tax=Streptococcus pyogenes TaxID=1314 RepID=UPI003DA07E3B